MISFAQAREDILLNRALQHVHHDHASFIDVGGFDPNIDSVTRHFYDHGWRGINIEPTSHLFQRFVSDRPLDVNLQVAVSDNPGELEFFEVENEQLGTLEKRFADVHAASGLAVKSYVVPTMTLAQICNQYVTRDINFLKIDVEGHEGPVIRGMDFVRYRPWILVIEACEPNNLEAPTFQEWDEDVKVAGYDFVYTDMLNRYYVAKEHSELGLSFSVPADDYIYDWVRRHYEHQIGELNAQLRSANDKIAQLTSS